MNEADETTNWHPAPLWLLACLKDLCTRYVLYQEECLDHKCEAIHALASAWLPAEFVEVHSALETPARLLALSVMHFHGSILPGQQIASLGQEGWLRLSQLWTERGRVGEQMQQLQCQNCISSAPR